MKKWIAWFLLAIAINFPVSAQIWGYQDTCKSQSINVMSVSASPYTVQNTNICSAVINITGGTVSVIATSRDNITFVVVGLLTGQVVLAPGDWVRVTYITPPTMTMFPL